MKTRFLLLATIALGLFASIVASGASQNLVLILDASNSMNKAFGPETRIAAARTALDSLLDRMPEQGNLGLIAFGSRVNYQNETESCQDIQNLFPLAPYTAAVGESIVNAVAGLTPQGKTPLADALSLAANDITALGGGGVIVLISDGEGNCGGQEAVVAQTLAMMSPPIVLHVVGLDMEFDASQALRAMAEATGGSYWGVADAAALADALFAAVVAEPTPVKPAAADGVPPEYVALAARLGFTIDKVIYGTDGDDVLYGTAGNDLIFGLGGNDFLISLSGRDILVGGPGNDIMEGGVDGDVLFGNEGDDLLFGGSGDDVLCGGPGNDSLEGEAGCDVLDGGTGCDTLLGGEGENLLYSMDPMDILFQGMAVQGSYGLCGDGCNVPPAPPAPTCAHPGPPCPPAAPACPAPMPAPAVCKAPAVAKVINEGESLQLHGSVSDYDCDILSVLWQATAGRFDNATSLDPIYTAPMIAGCGDLEVEVALTAVDRCGASSTDSFRIRVVNVNHAPSVSGGEDLWVDEGSAVVLSATAADVDGEGLRVLWAVGGPGSFDDPTALQAVFHAPIIDLCEGLTIQLMVTVIDPCGASACDAVLVHVRNVNRAPLVELGPDFAVDEGQTIRWTPVVEDPDCDALRYCWTATAGTFDNPATQNPLFALPATFQCAGEFVTVTLTVTDPCGLTASDSVKIQVRNINRAPTVELGPGLCVNEGSTITLCPQAADPDGDVLRYAWTVSAGRLDSTCVPTPVFIAPIIKDCVDIDVTVTVTVTDPCGLSATDTVIVRVLNVNQAPVVHADP